MLQHILNPAFLYSFEKGEGEQLLGPPNPEGDNPESITSVFITKVTILVYIQVFENKKLFLSFCFSILICISCSISKYYDQLYQITYITELLRDPSVISRIGLQFSVYDIFRTWMSVSRNGPYMAVILVFFISKAFCGWTSVSLYSLRFHWTS